MATITVNAGGNLQSAINSAGPGDIIEYEAGATWDGVFTLPEHTLLGIGDGDYVTVRSTGHALLPNGRVSASDAVNMPRIRTNSTEGAATFTAAENASYWKLDGLEITDNAGTNNINTLMDFGSHFTGINHFIVTRCYIHQKESGLTYTRSAIRAMIFNGHHLYYNQCCIEDFIGYPYSSLEPHNSESLLVGSGSSIFFENNDSSVWYNHIFLGGSDTPATHTATLTNASTTEADFSSVSGLEVGAFIRFSVNGTATLSNAGGDCTGSTPDGNCPTLTRLTGEAWVASDGNQNNNWGDSCLITSVADPSKTGIVRLMDLTGNNVFTTLVATSPAAGVPNGAITYTIYQTAKVTAIVGNHVTYDPQGTTEGIDYATNALSHTPASAAWCQGDEGRICDVTIRGNALHINPVFAAHIKTLTTNGPKGIIEVKNVLRFLFEGNVVTGYPAVLAFTAANQNGSAPWITVDYVTIQNNWFKPDTGFASSTRTMILMSDDNYLNTISPTTTVIIRNNLGTGGLRSFAHIKNGYSWTLTHNTIVNAESSTAESAIMLTSDESTIPVFVFYDNICGHVCYGLQFYPDSYPNRDIFANLLVDADSGCSGGINENTYGTGSALSPIPTSFLSVGFFDPENGDYSLDPDSPYKGQGTEGSDPGVDMVELLAALNLEEPESAGRTAVSARTAAARTQVSTRTAASRVAV